MIQAVISNYLLISSAGARVKTTQLGKHFDNTSLFHIEKLGLR